MINIYIDTNYKGMKGKADYGYLLEWERCGEIKKTLGPDIISIDDTRNRAFVKTAIQALRRVCIKDPVRVYATNGYLIHSMEKNLPEFWSWQNWIKGNGDRVCNCDLWMELLQILKEKSFENVEWIGGEHKHSGNIIREIEKQYEVRAAPL